LQLNAAVHNSEIQERVSVPSSSRPRIRDTAPVGELLLAEGTRGGIDAAGNGEAGYVPGTVGGGR